jgi:hypothetical protein
MKNKLSTIKYLLLITLSVLLILGLFPGQRLGVRTEQDDNLIEYALVDYRAEMWVVLREAIAIEVEFNEFRDTVESSLDDVQLIESFVEYSRVAIEDTMNVFESLEGVDEEYQEKLQELGLSGKEAKQRIDIIRGGDIKRESLDDIYGLLSAYEYYYIHASSYYALAGSLYTYLLQNEGEYSYDQETLGLIWVPEYFGAYEVLIDQEKESRLRLDEISMFISGQYFTEDMDAFVEESRRGVVSHRNGEAIDLEFNQEFFDFMKQSMLGLDSTINTFGFYEERYFNKSNEAQYQLIRDSLGRPNHWHADYSNTEYTYQGLGYE